MELSIVERIIYRCAMRHHNQYTTRIEYISYIFTSGTFTTIQFKGIGPRAYILHPSIKFDRLLNIQHTYFSTYSTKIHRPVTHTRVLVCIWISYSALADSIMHKRYDMYLFRTKKRAKQAEKTQTHKHTTRHCTNACAGCKITTEKKKGKHNEIYNVIKQVVYKTRNRS